MLLPKSRYRKTRFFNAPDGGDVPFRGLRPRSIGPATGLVEHTLREGDRLDHLARHYYNDDRLWWRILDANPQIVFGGELLPVEDWRPTESSESSSNGESLVGQIILIPRGEEA